MSAPGMPPEPLRCDVLVVGDEVESILTAVSAARAGVTVALARRSTGSLGGLSVRGGLSYMDITPEFVTGLFAEFLERARLIRVALNPVLAAETLATMLQEAKVTVLSGVSVTLTLDADGFPNRAALYPVLAGGVDPASPDFTQPVGVLYPRVVIDATPDADIARALGVPYLIGLGGVLGEAQNFLGVSPVFRIARVAVDALQAFEAELRARPELPALLAQALPNHPEMLRAEYVTRPTDAPEGMDYLDILNPVIGIDYHLWRHGDAQSYPEAGIFIDGGNVSRLADGTLGFNGLVAQAAALDLDLDDLLALSHGGPTPTTLSAEMRAFERYLRERAGFPGAQIIPPAELYVRQTVTLLARENMTARRAIAGGVPPEQAVGTFSYWLDLRGTQLWRHFPGEQLPKPVFNVGLNVALPLTPALQNLAFIGRAAGYSPIGQGAGRIVQHNALLGEGMGVAAALAALSHASLEAIVETAMPQVQAILKARRGDVLTLSGHATWNEAQREASALLKRDDEALDRLRFQATDFSLL